jgi:prephenate dehydrogenase
MIPFRHVAIYGCGLIGASFALALRRAGFTGRITAAGGRRGPREALERGLIDEIEESFAIDALTPCAADFVYLAAPIGAIVDFLRTRASRLSAGSLITDAGSTKSEICRAARSSLPSSVRFVGGHPMAGSEHTGVEYARADLFDRAVYALAVTDQTDSEALGKLEAIVAAIGARSIRVSPETHDAAVALISHLPQLTATGLAGLLDTGRDENLASKLAASGWRDTTRLAGSSWNVWRDIILTNRDNISTVLGRLISELQDAKDALEVGDLNQLRELFARANRTVEEQRRTRYQTFDKV